MGKLFISLSIIYLYIKDNNVPVRILNAFTEKKISKQIKEATLTIEKELKSR